MIKGLRDTFKRLMDDNRGQGFVEFGLIIIVVVLVVAGAAYALANDGIAPKFEEIEGEISGANVPSID